MKKTFIIAIFFIFCIGCLQCKAFNLLSHEEPEKIELTEKNTSDGERERGIGL